MMTLYLLRHLPTLLNRQRKLQGRLDSEIIETSLFDKSIQSNLGLLRNASVTIVYVSPLKRALQTVDVYKDILGEIEVRVDNRLTEFDFGEFENRPREEMIEKFGTIWNLNFTRIPFGESMDDFQKRVNDFSNELKASAHNQVLVVSHGVVLRYLYCKLSGYDVDTLNKIPFKNNEIKTVRVI